MQKKTTPKTRHGCRRAQSPLTPAPSGRGNSTICLKFLLQPRRAGMLFSSAGLLCRVAGCWRNNHIALQHRWLRFSQGEENGLRVFAIHTCAKHFGPFQSCYFRLVFPLLSRRAKTPPDSRRRAIVVVFTLRRNGYNYQPSAARLLKPFLLCKRQ